MHDSLHTAYATVRANINLAHQCSMEHYEGPFLPYSVGDLVRLHASAVKPGNFPQWKGPYTIIDRISEVN